MLQIDSSLFSNVILTVQRTSRLAGGAIQGLPGGVVIDGLQGVNSFGSDIAEAQKEFEMGRTQSCLARVKQIEMQFSGISGRWSSTVGNIISTAKQGNQKLSIQKLNEVKNAQTKMQAMTSPAHKAFRDLIMALESAVSVSSHKNDSDPNEGLPQEAPVETPNLRRLGSFSAKYVFGEKLELKRGVDKKLRVNPGIEKDNFYYLVGLDRVVGVLEVDRATLQVFDYDESAEREVDSGELKDWIRQGIWLLEENG